jgi:hypothetical protein
VSGKQARFAKHAKAMAKMYCYPDGTHPGPVVPLNLVFKAVYRSFRQSLFAVATPLFDAIKAMPSGSSLRWGGTTAYFDVQEGA